VIIVLTVLFAVAVPTLLTVQQEWMISEAVVEAAQAEEATEAVTVDLLSAWDTAFYGLGVWDDTTFQRSAAGAQVKFVVTRTSDQLFLIEAHAAASGSDFVHGSALTVRAASQALRPRAALTVADSAYILNEADLIGDDYVVPPGWPSSVCMGSQDRGLAGVLTPDAARVTHGGGAMIRGLPAILTDASVGVSTLDEPAGLPYTALAAAADHTISALGATPLGGCVTSNPAHWGDPTNPTGSCGDHFPIVHFKGDLTLPSGTRGQGILLVDGDLTLPGDVHYYGLVVVRGTLKMTGQANRVRGAVYARFAVLDAGGVVTNTMIYNVSCVLDRVRAAHPELGSGVHPVASRSWVDLSGTN